jgi:hypothetical protein
LFSDWQICDRLCSMPTVGKVFRYSKRFTTNTTVVVNHKQYRNSIKTSEEVHLQTKATPLRVSRRRWKAYALFHVQLYVTEMFMFEITKFLDFVHRLVLWKNITFQKFCCRLQMCHRSTSYNSLLLGYVCYGNWLDSGEMRLSTLIGRHVVLSSIRFYRIGKVYRRTSGVGFAWGSQGCWMATSFTHKGQVLPTKHSLI